MASRNNNDRKSSTPTRPNKLALKRIKNPDPNPLPFMKRVRAQNANLPRVDCARPDQSAVDAPGVTKSSSAHVKIDPSTMTDADLEAAMQKLQSRLREVDNKLKEAHERRQEIRRQLLAMGETPQTPSLCN